jgi:hypothetical protein
VKELLEVAETFDRSRPVFRLTFSSDGDSIDLNVHEPVHPWRPVAEEGNVINEIVTDRFAEVFDLGTKEFLVDADKIAQEAMEVVRSSIGRFIEKNIGMKNPRQSKLYRWTYRGMPNTTEFNDTLVLVYKYLRSFSDDDMRADIGSKAHVDNAIALLTAMEEKYSEQR